MSTMADTKGRRTRRSFTEDYRRAATWWRRHDELQGLSEVALVSAQLRD